MSRLMITVAAFALCIPASAHAFDVLGCTYHPTDPGGFVSCVRGAADHMVSDARDELNRKLDDERQRAADVEKKLRAQAAELAAKLPTGSAELALLEAARKLNLQPMFACLEASGVLGQLRDDVIRMARDPAAASRIVFQRVWSLMERNLDTLVADDLARLDALSSPAAVGGAAARAIQRIEALAAKDPALSCVMRQLGGSSAAVAQATQELQAQVRKRATELFEQKIRPLVQRTAWKALDRVLTKVLGELAQRPGPRVNVSVPPATSSALASGISASSGGGPVSGSATLPAAAGPSTWSLLKVDPEAIATRAYVAGILLPRMEKISAAMAALDRVLVATAGDTSPAARTAVTRAAMDLRAAYAADPGVTAVVELEIGLGILKAIGSNYIEYGGVIAGIPGGGVLWDGFYDAFTLGMNLGYDLFNGTGGLIPELGAYAFAVVVAVLQVTEKEPGGSYVKAALKELTLKGFSAIWGSLVDSVGAELIKATGPTADRELARVKANNPTLAFLIDRMQPAAIRLIGASYLKRLQSSTQDYDAKVQAVLSRFGL